ncbi:MAG: VOC family protein [Solidesulfovibrio sp. DCME]|uniref:VOC family protein n=1 Tax=Solidesulfovibrio sp. DCME TaxID=3447380 RepID=UPI003D11E801
MDEPCCKNGFFSWNELMTTDVEGAKAFYAALLGWNLEDKPMPEMGMTYTLAKVGDAPVGGIMAMPPEAGTMPPIWGSYVSVADVDAAAQKAVELGGKVYKEPTDIPGVGRFCVIGDPQGAFLSLIKFAMEG